MFSNEVAFDRYYQLYSKAGDVDALASFYESCAQIEIDEYRDYEKEGFHLFIWSTSFQISIERVDRDYKIRWANINFVQALGAMTEALKYFSNSKSPYKDEEIQSLKRRISEVEQFVQVI